MLRILAEKTNPKPKNKLKVCHAAASDEAAFSYAITASSFDAYPDVFKDSSEVRIYSREYKLAAIKRYLQGNESIRLISIDLGLPDHTILRDWLNKYREGGEAAIQTSYSRKNYLLHEERQNKIASKELKDRLEYLEAENEFLKKYYSLILERSRRLKKKSK